jgi:hypothetical protein
MNTLNFGTTKQTPNLEDHRTLDGAELDAVAGGGDSGAFRGRYQLRLDTANGLLSAQGTGQGLTPQPPQGS